jgi:LPXTG-site transpeptidase (sortase) family protein
MKSYIKENLGRIIGYLYIIIGALLIISNGIDAYAYYSREDVMLSNFYEKDKSYIDMEEVIAIIDNIKNNINVPEEYEETEIEVETPNNEVKDEPIKNYDYDDYVSVLKIPKIKLEKGLFAKSSKYNSVEYNVMLHEKSDTPTVVNGNVILVAHSGTSSVSYFRNLVKLNVGDTAEIYYHGRKYTYQIVNIYEVDKTGTVQINRNIDKNTLTMITCKHNTDKQIVFISELVSVDIY